MTQEEILKQGAPIEPNSFETGREEQWYKVGLYEGSTASPWHSVADGDLPNKDGRYLTLHTNGIPCIHAFNTQYRRWVINAYQSIVKYWMEIPELPTE
ncbi:MAG: hypothetical protein ACFN1F_01960 [Segatella sp.]